jgi:hypothetical protein
VHSSENECTGEAKGRIASVMDGVINLQPDIRRSTELLVLAWQGYLAFSVSEEAEYSIERVDDIAQHKIGQKS